jgi:hypothetical protein
MVGTFLPDIHYLAAAEPSIGFFHVSRVCWYSPGAQPGQRLIESSDGNSKTGYEEEFSMSETLAISILYGPARLINPLT